MAAPTAKSEAVSTVSTLDACVSTEDGDFDEVDEEEVDPAGEAPRCQVDLVTRVADRAFTWATRRLFRKYSPRWELQGTPRVA